MYRKKCVVDRKTGGKDLDPIIVVVVVVVAAAAAAVHHPRRRHPRRHDLFLILVHRRRRRRRRRTIAIPRGHLLKSLTIDTSDAAHSVIVVLVLIPAGMIQRIDQGRRERSPGAGAEAIVVVLPSRVAVGKGKLCARTTLIREILGKLKEKLIPKIAIGLNLVTTWRKNQMKN